MMRGEGDTKQRRENFSISLRKEGNSSAFLHSRQRVLRAQGIPNSPPTPYKLEAFRKLREDLERAATAPGVLRVMASIREDMSINLNPDTVPCREFRDAGLIGPVFRLARDEMHATALAHTDILEEAMWIISNLCLAPRDQLPLLFEHGLMDILAGALHHAKVDPPRHALWALANMLGEDCSAAELLRKDGFYPRILAAIAVHARDPKFGEAAAWFASNLLRCPAGLDQATEVKVLHVCVKLLRLSDSAVTQVEALWGLRNFIQRGKGDSADSRARIDVIAATDIFPVLLALYSSCSPPAEDASDDLLLLDGAMHVLAEVIYHSAELAKQLVSLPFVERLSRLLAQVSHEWSQSSIQAATLSLFANIAYTDPQFSAALNCPQNIDSLLCILLNAEMSWLWCGALKCIDALLSTISPQHLAALVRQHAILDFLLERLHLERHKTPDFYLNVLDVLNRVLESCVGFGLYDEAAQFVRSPHFQELYDLQRLKNPQVYEEIESIINKFCDSEL